MTDTEVIICRDGPLLVRGDHRLVDEDGMTVDGARTTVALCRCGRSSMRPICDGSHRTAGFRAPGVPEGRARRQSAGALAGGEVLPSAGLPRPVGPISSALVDALAGPPRELAALPALAGDPLTDDDLHLGLYLCFQAGDRGFAGTSRGWAVDPGLQAARRGLSSAFLDALVADLGPLPSSGDDLERLEAVIAADDSPSVAAYLAEQGTEAQLRELLIHRSAYQLKEADPHLRVLPSLSGEAKGTLLEILVDEHGGGRPERMHSELFARALSAFDLDRRECSHLDRLPGVTLATANLNSCLCDDPRWRGALLGHLTATELTSSAANLAYAAAVRRLGITDPDAVEYFDEHVEADGAHGPLAAQGMGRAFARDEPELGDTVLRGAQMLLSMEGRFARALLARWEGGSTLLRS